MKRTIFILLITFLYNSLFADINTIINIIDNGEFNKAKELINEKLKSNLSNSEIQELKFELERMYRINQDFSENISSITDYIKKYYPIVTNEMIKKWEQNNSIEYITIDGEKKYFSRAAQNLFRLEKDVIHLKDKTCDNKDFSSFNLKHTKSIVNNKNINTKTMKLKYILTVNADAVPAGEIVKVWMPYPLEIKGIQTNIKFIKSNIAKPIFSKNKSVHNSIYGEKKAVKNKPTIFSFECIYKAHVRQNYLNENDVKPYNIESEDYKNHTKELKPHIVFSDEIKTISKEIIGNETNQLIKAKKIFAWINRNIPWTGAREYSTIPNIPHYVLKNKRGDCGMVTLTFITLCRYNGIPARWQSGWLIHPKHIGLHDWGEFYIENYGWVPIDVSFGLQDTTDNKLKYFYLGNMDEYRLIVNSGISEEFYPKKKHFRSETVDFQRGEVEWKNENLYFDKWTYKMRAIISD